MPFGSLFNSYPRTARATRAHALAAMAALLAPACPSGDDRCSENEVFVQGPRKLEYCACARNTIKSAAGYGCTPCGDNEEVQNNQCICKEGYVRQTATGPCEMATGQAIGATCTDNASCGEPYPYCLTDGDDHYCTKQDCKSGECPPGYSCTSAGDSAICVKLPTGLGMACTAGGGECAAFEANYCESFMSKVCFVAGCATGEHECPGEYACCDLSALSGMPLSLCFAPSQLNNGLCPVGTLVAP